MKKLTSFFMLIFTLSTFSQIPNYYNDVNLNQSGTALKDALAVKIIATHTTFISYTPGVWDALKQADLDPTNPNNVLLIYGWNDTDADITNDRTRGKEDHGGGSGVWNREHVYSKSLANPNLGTTGPGADAHNLRPCDAQRNSSRSNRKFENGSGNSGITPSGNWYPGDEWKGDVARMMMYMYLRYGNQTLPTGVAVGTVNATDSNMINLFLEWNAEDPVSAVELQRNPVLENVQGNRNPFIDNPAFATQIWGGPQAEDKFGNGSGNNDTQAPTAPTNLTASNITQTSVSLNWSASTDNTAVTGYSIFNGATQIATTTNTNFSVTNLMAGTSYTFSVKAFDAAANVSSNSNSAAITTSNNGSGNGTVSELLISEYIEGSSNNKALEIANFTGATVDLSSYSLKKATNGSGSFSSTLALSGNLANGQVYVIAHGSANATILSKANTTNNGVMSFNGNDAIGLFKNNVIIDLIGNASSSSNFAQNITLQRKSSVISPNTNYTTTEWNSLAVDTISGLGNHTIDGGTPADTTAPSAPTNLVSSNITQTSVNLNWNAATDNVAVTGYDVYNGTSVIATVTSTNYQVTGLTNNTAYSFSIKAKDEANNVSAASNTVSITTLPTPVNYCSSKGNNVNYEYIDNVAIGGISNATNANGGYGDFTSQTGNLSFGNNTIIVSAGFSSSSYTEYWRVWIDFNKNGTFESNEQVVSGSSSSSGNLSYTFSVPTTALTGATRMRVSMKWNGAPTACETFSYGEVEDYTVNINASAKEATNKVIADGELKNEAPIFDGTLYPNPATNFINIQLKDSRNVSYKITNLIGQTVKRGQLIRNNLRIESLKSGMYIIEINDGQRSFVKKFLKR